MLQFVRSLVTVSEKAANIARTCRQEEHLFELLVQEKISGEANPRFVQDFKTLADVLIQECVKHDIGKLFPGIAPHIKGEENNVFCNTLGETVCIEIQDDVGCTAELLEKVLDGDKTAANLLALEVHRDVELQLDLDALTDVRLDVDALGIWIDPIDSTAEYINAKEQKHPSGIYSTGLQCVTVLIGAYDRDTGVPVVGVVNQPFHELIDVWKGCCYWGVSTADFRFSSSTIPGTARTNVICISSSESAAVKSVLLSSKCNFELVEAAGAGYKVLTVITGLADAYVLSKGSTFKWDTCGPQAILKSIGGNIASFSGVRSGQMENVDYRCNYNKTGATAASKIQKYCNESGIVAFRDTQILNVLLDLLKTT